MIENKFSFLVNNFPSSSEVGSVIDKTNQLEEHVLGTPKSHRSWTEFLLVSIDLSVALDIVIKVVKNYCIPWLFSYIRKKTLDASPRISSISQELDNRDKINNYVTLELNQLHHQLHEQNKQIEMVLQQSKDKPLTTINHTLQ